MEGVRGKVYLAIKRSRLCYYKTAEVSSSFVNGHLFDDVFLFGWGQTTSVGRSEVLVS
jgi:hypothetical protein